VLFESRYRLSKAVKWREALRPGGICHIVSKVAMKPLKRNGPANMAGLGEMRPLAAGAFEIT
jgi:hypothetical protein